MEETKIGVLLVDDHGVACRGLRERGRTNKDIATDLGITERTARTHVSNILGKLGAPEPDPGRAVRGRRKLVHD